MKNDELVIKKTFSCSKRELFDAWSNANIMAKWFLAASEKFKDSSVESNFTIDGQFSITMYFENATESKMKGQYKDIIRYSLIKFSWHSAIATDSLVTLKFREVSANRAELKLVHSLFPSEESRNMHNRGWDACLANLERFFNSELD